MNITWIIVVVTVIVIAAIVALVVGLWLRKRNQISLSKPEEKRELTQQEKSGNYQAGTAFDFTSAAPSSPRAPEPVRPAPTATATSTAAPTKTPLGDDTSTVDETPTAPASTAPERPAAPAPAETDTTSVRPQDTPAAPDTAVTESVPPAALDEQAPETPTAVDSATAAPAATDSAPVQDAPPTPGTDSDVTQTVVPDIAQREDIAPAEGRMNRLRGRLSRSNNAVGRGLLGLLGAGDLDEESWEEIEDTLIMADLGTATTMRVVERLRSDMASRQVRTETEVRELLRTALIDNLHPEMDRSIKALPHEGTPAVILVVGVNGTGKTTTTGKLARVLVASGRTIVLGAADTFRAAAADQLQTWGERVGAETVRGKEGADPAAIAFDAVSRGIDTGVDAVLVDTAGRLHTKTGLMDQLGKVKRVVEKKSQVSEVLLVIDATTGQNGLTQARVFRDVVDITGVVLTKLDGTAKGGIVFQVQHELGVPVKLVGLGEGADDLAPFVPEAFVDALLA